MPVPWLVLGFDKDAGLDVAAARRSLSVAWGTYRQSTIQHYREGLDFGRVCYEWRAKYKAQGSHKSKGFDHLLVAIGIPKTTAYRWIRRYEMKNGLRAKRNEVADARHNQEDPSRSEKPTSFRLFLSSERRKQFEEDIETLGGSEKVSEIFLDFVARAAFEKRSADALIVKKLHYARDYRHIA